MIGYKFTFIEWLYILDPKTSISITDIDGKMYNSIKRNGLNFTMKFNGIDFNKILKKQVTWQK